MIDNCIKHCQKSFEDLQKVFLVAPLLGYSYFTLPFCGENGSKSNMFSSLQQNRR